MGNPVILAVKTKENEYSSIYVHWADGSKKLLNKHYKDKKKVESLIALGDLSVLGNEIGEKQDFDNPLKDKSWCLAYSRDRGEEDVEARVGLTGEELQGEISVYGAFYILVFDNGKWKKF